MIGEKPPEVFCHWVASDGTPPEMLSRSPDAPLPLVTKTQVDESAGLIQTARDVRMVPPWGTLMSWISPPTWPGPPWPLRFSRLISRSFESLPDCTARRPGCPGAGKIAGAVDPRSTSPL